MKVEAGRNGRESTMRKEVITAKQLGGLYSKTSAHGTKAGGFIFVTGQVASNPGTDPSTWVSAGEMGTVEEQTIRVLENIKAILAEGGTSFEHVVKRNVYLTHLGDYGTVYKILERYFPSPVASTGVLTGLFPVSARVEIDVIAAVPDGDPSSHDGKSL
jgi:2-iminobutanoate/2-iminopropanoate deaminase